MARAVLTILAGIILPLAITTAYLELAGPGERRSGNMDMAVLSLAVLAGLGCVATLPFRRILVRVLVGLLYVALIVPILFLHVIDYVCGRYNQCL